MRKTILLLSVILLLTTYCFSQEKGYIAISLGPSIPTGDFASKDVNNESAGLAKPGAIFDISFAYKLGQNFGLSALLRGQANSVDDQVFLDELHEENSLVTWTADSKSWLIGGFMFGAYGSFPIGEGKTSFDARGMIGFLHASSPEVTLTGVLGGTSLG